MESFVGASQAQAHLALLFDRDNVWEAYVDIPQGADIVASSFETTTHVPAGTPIRLHLHNHGQNTSTIAKPTVADES